MHSNILYIFSPIAREEPLRIGQALANPAVILRPAVREKLCPSETAPFAFRLELATGAIVFAGSTPQLERQRQIRSAVLADVRAYDRDYSYRTITRDSGAAPLSLVYQVK